MFSFRRWIDKNLPTVRALRGFEVVIENTRDDIATDDVVARMDEALGLIERYQPWRLAHMRRDLVRFRVLRYPCRGAYVPADRTVITELTFLARRDITAAPVAASIIHEGMHARVHRMGVTRGDWNHADEERLCRRAELDFGEALPPELGAPVIERARWSLALDDAGVAPAIDWAEAQRRVNDVDRATRGQRDA